MVKYFPEIFDINHALQRLQVFRGAIGHHMRQKMQGFR
jgi:hypothetical protein